MPILPTEMKNILHVFLLFLTICRSHAFDPDLWSLQNPNPAEWPGSVDFHDMVVQRATDPSTGATESFFFAVGDSGVIRSSSGRAGSWCPVYKAEGSGMKAIIAESVSTISGTFTQVVAVGAEGRLVTVRGDSEPEVSRISGAGNFMSMAAGQNAAGALTVVVDDLGQIFSGSNSSFTRTLDATGHAWRGVAFGNGRWIAVGDDARSAVSTDGMTWDLYENRVSNGLEGLDFHDVCYGGEIHNGDIFVAVGEGGMITRTNRGVQWTTSEPYDVHSQPLLNIDFLGSFATWIASGKSGKILRASNEGTSFTEVLLENDSKILAVAQTTQRIVMLGEGARGFTHRSSIEISQRQLDYGEEGGLEPVEITSQGFVNVPWGVTIRDREGQFVSAIPQTGLNTGITEVSCEEFDLIQVREEKIFINNIPLNIVQNGGDNPLPPVLDEVTVTSSTSVRLKFTSSEGANRYQANYRKIDQLEFVAGPNETPTVSQGTGTTIELRGLNPNTDYDIVLRAVKVSGSGSDAILGISEPSNIKTIRTRLAGSSNLRGELILRNPEDETEGYLGVDLSWSLVRGASSYLLERALPSSDFEELVDLGGDQRLFRDLIPSLSFQETIRYRITTTGGDSTLLSVTTPPRGVTAKILSSGRVNISLLDFYKVTFEVGKLSDQFSVLSGNGLECEYRLGVNGEWIRVSGGTLRRGFNGVDDPTPAVEDPNEPGLWTHTGSLLFPIGAPLEVRFRSDYFSSSDLFSPWVQLGPLCSLQLDPVTQFQVSTKTATELRLAWQGHPDASDYRIRTSSRVTLPGGQNIFLTIRDEVIPRGQNFHILDRLQGGREYTISIVARTGDGEDATCISEPTVLVTRTLSAGPRNIRAFRTRLESGVAVTWDRVSGNAGYVLQRRGFNSLTGPPEQINQGFRNLSMISMDTESYRDLTQNPDLSYQYRVAARGDDGFLSTDFSDASNTINLPPLPPEIRFLERLPGNIANLQWRITTGSFLTEMVVQISEDEFSGYTTVATEPIENRIPLFGGVEVDGLDSLQDYYFRIAVRDRFGMQSPFTAPEQLTTLRALFISSQSKSIAIKWDEDSSVEKWELTRSKTGLNGEFETIALLSGEILKYDDIDVSESEVYHYRLIALNDEGDKSDIQVGVLLPKRPDNFTAGKDGEAVILKWNAGGPSDSFQVEWRSGTSGSFQTIQETTLKDFRHTTPAPGINQYRIRAVREGFRSNPSSVESVTFPSEDTKVEITRFERSDQGFVLEFRATAGVEDWKVMTGENLNAISSEVEDASAVVEFLEGQYRVTFPMPSIRRNFYQIKR